MRQHARVTDQLDAATGLTPRAVALLAVVARTGITQPSYHRPFVTYWSLLYTAPVVLLGIVATQWYFIFDSCKRDTFELRAGRPFFDKVKFREEVANKYVGYQVCDRLWTASSGLRLSSPHLASAHLTSPQLTSARLTTPPLAYISPHLASPRHLDHGPQVSSMTVSFLLITFLYLLLFVAFLPLVVASAGNEQATEALRGGGRYVVGLLPGLLIPMVLSLGFQLVMNRLVFFQNSSGKGFKATGNTWLRFRFLCTPLLAPSPPQT